MEEIKAYAELWKRLLSTIDEDGTDSPQAKAIRKEMDSFWEGMDRANQKKFYSLLDSLVPKEEQN